MSENDKNVVNILINTLIKRNKIRVNPDFEQINFINQLDEDDKQTIFKAIDT